MAEIKTFADWERKKSVMFTDESIDLDQEMTEAEFDKLYHKPTGWAGMDHEGREQFLRQNGYKVTRKNMLDHELSNKPEDEDESPDV
jgi:hypothetical protein